MEKIKLLDNWKFCKGVVSSLKIMEMSGKAPEVVTLPHDAMIYEKRTKETKNGSQTGFYPGGIYTYFKDIDVPEEWENRAAILEFEGIYETAMVYVNGALAATNLYGYSGFFVDLKPYLNYGQMNQIKVIADNSAEENSRWYSGSGIYRDVNLYLGGSTYIPPEGVKITTISADEKMARLELAVQIENISEDSRADEAQVDIYYEGAVICSCKKEITDEECGLKQFTWNVEIEHPHLWDTEYPNLYQIEVTLLKNGEILDKQKEHFGIRTIYVDGKHGFCLNGKSLNLRGTCLHHDNGIIGAATIYDAERRKIRIIKEAGFNSIRSSHHPISKAMLDICDEMGIIVMDELFDMWTVHKNSHDFALHFLDEGEKVTTRMVNKDYNHPCVAIYSIGNEISELGTTRGVEISRMLCKKLHELDDTRFTTCGVNGLNAAGARLFEIMRDVAPLIKRKDEGNSGDNQGQSMGSNALNGIMEFMSGEAGDAFAAHPKLSEAIAGVSDATDIVGLNYMTGRHVLEAQLHPNKAVVGTETFPADIFRLWTLVEDYSHIIGDFTWTGYDYLGEAGCGIFYYDGTKNFGSVYPDRLAYIGDITITGVRRPISYYREVVYGLRHEPYIAVERVDRNGQTPSKTPWMFKDNISSWTWTGYEGTSASVDVYSDAEEVELFLNDESLGRKKAGKENQYMAEFTVPYQAGTLMAIDYVNGMERGRYSLETAKKSTTLDVKMDKKVLTANGQDLCYLNITLCDESGKTNQQEIKQITVSVDGAGKLQGLGSSNPSNEEDYFDRCCNTFDGDAMACVRAGHESGIITVTISANGCEDVVRKIEVR